MSADQYHEERPGVCLTNLLQAQGSKAKKLESQVGNMLAINSINSMAHSNTKMEMQ